MSSRATTALLGFTFLAACTPTESVRRECVELSEQLVACGHELNWQACEAEPERAYDALDNLGCDGYDAIFGTADADSTLFADGGRSECGELALAVAELQCDVLLDISACRDHLVRARAAAATATVPIPGEVASISAASLFPEVSCDGLESVYADTSDERQPLLKRIRCAAAPDDDDLTTIYEHDYAVCGFFGGTPDQCTASCVCTEFAALFHEREFGITGLRSANLARASNWPDVTCSREASTCDASNLFHEVDCGAALPGDIVYYDRGWSGGSDTENPGDLTLEDAQDTAHNTGGKHVAVVIGVNANDTSPNTHITTIADSSSTADGVNVWSFNEVFRNERRTYRASRGADGAYGGGDDYVNWVDTGTTRYRRYVCLRHRERSSCGCDEWGNAYRTVQELDADGNMQTVYRTESICCDGLTPEQLNEYGCAGGA